MCQMMQNLRTDGYNEGWESGMAKGWEGGRADGIVEGKAEGKAEGARMTAQNLKKLGMDSVTIAGAVGYDTETVENWIKEYENHSL